MTLRYVDKFENNAGTVSLTFPTNMLEWEPRQALNLGLRNPIGGNYPHDFGISQKNESIETIRFLAVESTEAALEATIDDIRQKAYEIGRGKLWMLNSDGSRRWAYARIEEMPDFTIGPKQHFIAPCILRFARISNWYAETVTTIGPTAISSSPTTILVNNAGNAGVRNALIRIEAAAASAWTNLQIDNDTNGYHLATTRDSTLATDVMEVDAGRWEVLFNGVNDFDKVTLGTSQVGLMRFDPGYNSLKFTSDTTPNMSVTVTFFAGFN